MMMTTSMEAATNNTVTNRAIQALLLAFLAHTFTFLDSACFWFYKATAIIGS